MTGRAATREAPERACRQRTYAAACLVLLLAGAAAHLWYLLENCPLDLAADEAHYWDWSRRLDLSYYSKGPLVAYLIAAGRLFLADWSRALLGSEVLAVRVPAIVLAVLTGLGIYVLARAVLDSARLALAAVALTFTMPILAAGAMLMTIDAPLMCAWTWALVCVERALRRERPTIFWLAAGLLLALGILAKYTMVLMFPVVGLALLSDRRLRRLLRQPGPYLGAAVGLLGFIPIVIWNARHDWVSFRHLAGQAGLTQDWSLDPAGVFSYVAGQALVINVPWFIGMLWAAVDLLRAPRHVGRETHDVPGVRLLLLAMLLPWGVFLAFSPITKVQPNWPAVALVPGTILLALWLARRLRLPPRGGRTAARAFTIVGILLGAATVVGGHHSEWLTPLFARLAEAAPPWELTPIARYDPTVRLRGWSALGRAVGQVLCRQRAGGDEPFVLTDNYQLAAEIAFYCPGNPRVFCAQAALGGRLSQYDLWPNPLRDPERFIGRPCVYVGRLHAELTGAGGASPPVLPALRRVRTVEYRLGDHLARIWTIYVCQRFAGFPARGASAARRY